MQIERHPYGRGHTGAIYAFMHDTGQWLPHGQTPGEADILPGNVDGPDRPE